MLYHHKAYLLLFLHLGMLYAAVELQKPIANPSINASNITAAFRAAPLQPLPATAPLNDQHWGALICMASTLAHAKQDRQQTADIVQWIHDWTYTVTLADEPLAIRRAMPAQLNKLRNSTTEVDRAINSQSTTRYSIAVQRLLTEISKTIRLDARRYPRWRQLDQALLGDATDANLCASPPAG